MPLLNSTIQHLNQITTIVENKNKLSIDDESMIKETFNKITTQKKGKILKNNIEILDLIKKDLNTRDFLMIKGSNATGLNTIVSKIKLGQRNAL